MKKNKKILALKKELKTKIFEADVSKLNHIYDKLYYKWHNGERNYIKVYFVDEENEKIIYVGLFSEDDFKEIWEKPSVKKKKCWIF